MNLKEVNVTTALKKAAENDTLENLKVDMTAMSISGPLDVGKDNFSLVGPWRKKRQRPKCYTIAKQLISFCPLFFGTIFFHYLF